MLDLIFHVVAFIRWEHRALCKARLRDIFGGCPGEFSFGGIFSPPPFVLHEIFGRRYMTIRKKDPRWSFTHLRVASWASLNHNSVTCYQSCSWKIVKVHKPSFILFSGPLAVGLSKVLVLLHDVHQGAWQLRSCD